MKRSEKMSILHEREVNLLEFLKRCAETSNMTYCIGIINSLRTIHYIHGYISYLSTVCDT